MQMIEIAFISAAQRRKGTSFSRLFEIFVSLHRCDSQYEQLSIEIHTPNSKIQSLLKLNRRDRSDRSGAELQLTEVLI